MRLATRALLAALATLVLCAAVSAQTLRSPNDPRNQSPAVGTGGQEGGPTGLFTIYDGSTLRRGESLLVLLTAITIVIQAMLISWMFH